jgi:hypothetical protein
MDDNPTRVAAFQDEIDSMKLKAAGAQNETRLLAVSILLGIAGLALAVLTAVQVPNESDPVKQTTLLATGSYLGIALLIAGGALFVRFSMARHLRLWLIRLVHEGRSNTDRIVAAIEANGTGPSER